MNRAHRYPDETLTFGEDQAVRMSQRTLVLILGATIAVAAAWFNLKSDYRDNHKAVEDLMQQRAADAADRKADHDLLVSVAKGVDTLQRRADWQDRREAREARTPQNP